MGALQTRINQGSRKKVLKMAMERLTTNLCNMMYYPEGSRNKLSDSPKDLALIKTPIIKYAYEKGIAVYPVSIFGTNQLIKKNILQFGSTAGIIFHEGVHPSKFSDKEEFIKYTWKQVQKGHQELSEKFARA